MKTNFTNNFVKVYFWQIISLALNFLALFIVVPSISGNKELYGIYTLVVSFSIFLNYADLGFIGAGKKFAAEYYANGQLLQSNRAIGFSLYFLSFFIFLFLIAFIVFGLNPDLIFKDISTSELHNISSSLFFILALSTPLILFQQLINSIFGIRIESFIVQRINILGSLIKIFSVFYFFREATYDIVGYFLFFQLINFLCVLIQFIVIQKRYKIKFWNLMSNIKFNKDLYNKIKPLALSGLFLNFSFILYYELDNLIIGKFFGPTNLAVYAVAFTLLNFIRSLIGIFYSPFSIRFNHFIGTGDSNKFKKLYIDLVKYSLPLFGIPIIALFIFAEPIIISWVGTNYTDSILIFKLLIIGFLFTFISLPTSIILNSLLRLKELYLINIIIPLVFWIGIYFTYNEIGIASFALFKSISFLIGALYYLKIYLNFTNFSIFKFTKIIILPIMLPIIYLYITGSYIVYKYPINEMSYSNLLFVACSLLFVISSAFLIQILSNRDLFIFLKQKYNTLYYGEN